MKYLLDKINKQTLFFISLIGIVVVSLVMVTTFAYQTLQVEYTSDSKKNLTVNAGVLDVSFKVTNRISNSNIPFLDDYKTANYSEFTIDNTKSSEDAAYKIKLVDLEYSDSLITSDFKYTIVKVNDNGLEVISEGDFSTLSSTEKELSMYRTIKKSSSEKIRLYLWIKNSDENQNDLSNSSFKGIIEINSMFDTETPTLKNTIILSAKNATGDRTIYKETPITKPLEEISGYKYYTDKVEEATSESSMTITTTYQGYYWTYGTGYTVDESTGKFTLTGVSTCKYNDGTCNTTLVGKYLVSYSYSDNASSTDTKKTTTNLSNIYKVTEAPASSTSSITMKYKSISSISYSTEKELSIASDDYGTSYYFRGNPIDNYVNYANMCWRIVRIQGDGSIKLILASEKTCSTSNLTTSSGYITDSAGTILTAIYGYKNVVVGSKTYRINDYINSEADKTNNARTKLNDWLTRKITSSSDLALLKEETWCIGDQTNGYSFDDTGEIVGTVSELINSGTEFDFTAGNKYYVTKTPSYKCETTGVDGETDTNTVGMLTMDEIAFAGGGIDRNSSYYLNNNATTNSWWGLSPFSFYASISRVYAFFVYPTGNMGNHYVNGSNSLRAAVTLVAGTTITGGNGTISSPYIVSAN